MEKSMLKFTNQRVIDVADWDNFVISVYGRPYNFQQQDGCKGRQNVYITVPAIASEYQNVDIPEEVNGKEMGVSFESWLSRDPSQFLTTSDRLYRVYDLNLFWERNFYPDVQMIANDMYSKGLLLGGEYTINIDW